MNDRPTHHPERIGFQKGDLMFRLKITLAGLMAMTLMLVLSPSRPVQGQAAFDFDSGSTGLDGDFIPDCLDPAAQIVDVGPNGGVMN